MGSLSCLLVLNGEKRDINTTFKTEELRQNEK
eukprot:bmy_10784T0